MIEAVLSDAGQKQLDSSNNGVKSWMQDLQDLAYDLEDVLDAFATQAHIYELMIKEDVHGRVLKNNDPNLASSPNNNMVQSIVVSGSKAVEHLSFMFNSGQDLTAKIEEINQQLKEILSQTKGLGLSVHVMQQQVIPPRAEREWKSWRESTSLLCEPFVYGREGDRKETISRLLNDESSMTGNNYVVIPIVGIGGIGKTTLAQLIYNDEEVNVFSLKAWVYKVLTGRRFLIVLDDIWNEKYSDWDRLRTPLRAGAKGSRVVATTRSQKVARVMNPQLNSMILLEGLSDDDCWRIIVQNAFDDAGISLSPNFSLMRDDMTRKCRGLPMVAKALGGLLRSKVEEDEWQETLHYNTLRMSESRVLEVLELSFHDLPSHLKRCYSYCSIFPYDHVFTEKDVILLWMAEGFLPENGGNKQMEDIGHDYFHDLVSRSFFEPSIKGSEYFKMHSLQSDLAREVAGKLCLAIKDCSVNKDWSKASCRARHISFTKLDEPDRCDDMFSLKVSHFRTFAHFDKHIFSGSSNRVLDLIGMFQCMRVLRLPHMEFTIFPESIGDLKLLRLLNLSYNNIEELPDSLSNLVNLQTLLLKGCDKLQKLLENMRCLINLRHVDIDGSSVREMPLRIGNLTNLQTLNNFIIGANAPIIRDLKNLNHLRGKLTITGLENVLSSNDAREARLHQKSGLHELEMVWDWGNFINGVDDNTRIDVLDQLEPHKSIKVLTLRNYKGVAFPRWLGDPSFTKMVIIKLVGCERYESLPSLGKLPSLKELEVQEMRGLKVVGYDFHGVGCSNPFPTLRTLRFRSMTSWESWLQSSADNRGFSCLQELSIKDCSSPQQSLPSCLPLLHTLEIQRCKQLLTERGNISSSDLSLSEEDLSPSKLANLTKLTISECPYLISFPEDLVLPGLRNLLISVCRNLESLPNQMHNFTSLQDLILTNCPKIHYFPKGGLPMNLLSLYMDGLNIEQPMQEWELHNLNTLEKLSISDIGCSSNSIYSFPNEDIRLPSSLTGLAISGFINMKSASCLSILNLTSLYVRGCPKLECFVDNCLPPELQELWVVQCPVLKRRMERDPLRHTLSCITHLRFC
ncbi:putative disease resistance protein At3g14460 [Chenopodium quinoa]|uniref:putative disease resistance protein At3g14460 n=1 Tax=Chenopodium quinoa TaxID=63459 RepID=UPI000B779165|nr:putative disease resistance protein At3g14460 [Chenopodium quinoa]